MPRLPGRSSGGLVLAAALLIAGCRTVEPDPLDPADILQTLEARRRVDAPDGAVDLARVVELARDRAPSLLSARQAEATARALADLPTPLPNPTVGVGALLLSGPGITSATRWGVEAAGSWLLDLNGNRSAATGLRAAEGRAAAVELAVQERETYLALRRGFVELGAAGDLATALGEVERGARSSAAAVRRLVDAGQASALDVAEQDIEVERAVADILAAEEVADEARARLAATSGIDADSFAAVESPEPPEAVPDRDDVLALLVAGHPALDAIRARYDVAEAELRAVVAARFPGLSLEPGYEHEDKQDRYALGVGMELPLFDRGDLEITAAEGRRSALRAEFEAEMTRRIGDVDAALRRLAHRDARRAHLAEQTAPAARRGLDLARRGLESGTFGGLRYLNAVRTERAVRLDVVAAERAVLDAWCDLEAACGVPLLRFPSTDLPVPTADEGDGR